MRVVFLLPFLALGLACERTSPPVSPSPVAASSASKVAEAPAIDAGPDAAPVEPPPAPVTCLHAPVAERMGWEERYTSEFHAGSKCFHSLMPWIGKRRTKKVVTAIASGQVSMIEATSLELASREPRQDTFKEPFFSEEKIEKPEELFEMKPPPSGRDGAYAQPVIPVARVAPTGTKRGEASKALASRIQYFITAIGEEELKQFDPPPKYTVSATFLEERDHAFGRALAFKVRASMPGSTMGMCRTLIASTTLEGEVLVLKETTIVVEAHLTGRYSSTEQTNCQGPAPVVACANGVLAMNLTTACP